MAKPVILTVDDEPQVLNAVNRDLRQHYKGEYRIIRASSGEEALETVRQLKQRNEMVALFLSDQRMPGMTGTQFLTEARTYFPQARKVLLTAYADTSAAIESINTIGLDYYLMKPWDPPEQHLYPVLDDLLGDWWTSVPVPFEGIRVVGTQWSSTCHNVKDFLARNRIPYQWLDLEQNEEAQTYIHTLGKAHPALPVIFLPDGETLENPDIPTLAAKVGLKTHASQPFYDLIVIGGGPAGLGAAVYGASEGLKTLLVEKEATGGQAGTSSRIENYLGFPQGLSGAELAQRATIQANRLGAEILTAQEVKSLRADGGFELGGARDGRVARGAGVEGRLAREHDVTWRVEVGLADAEAIDLVALGLKARSLGGHRERRAGRDRSEAISELSRHKFTRNRTAPPVTQGLRRNAADRRARRDGKVGIRGR